MHYHKTGLGAQCAHPEPKSRAQCPCRGSCCAHSKLVAACHARSQRRSRSACAGREHSAQVVGACRDLSPLPSPRQGRDIISRSRPPFCLLKLPRSRPQKWGRDTKPPPCSLNHVATSNRCRDTTQAYPGRDTKIRSRPSWRVPYVATSISCRHTCPQWAFQVATPKIPIATSLAATHVATSKLMSRPQVAPQNPSYNTLKPKPGCDLTSLLRLQITQPMSRHEIHVTTKANQSQPQPNHVATSIMGHDPTLEFGSSHSSFCLAQFLFLFSNFPVAFLLLLKMQ